MSAISRNQFEHAFGNHSIDLHDPELEAAVRGAGLDLQTLDNLDGAPDGRITGQQALNNLYNELDALDKKTKGLGSDKARRVYDAAKSAAIAPVPISAEQGRAIAASAREKLAEDRRDANGLSVWSHGGTSSCENPQLSRPDYAKRGYKCNVFAGEAVTGAGLPFPVNEMRHYVIARLLPTQPQFLQRLSSVDQVREGDLVSIHRLSDASHVEVVTGVDRRKDGTVANIRSVGAHDNGIGEGTETAARFLRSGRHRGDGLVIEGETFRILRPMTQPPPVLNSESQFSIPLKG